MGNISNKKRVAFLDTLLDIKKKNPEIISFNDIQEEVDTFMFEGHDTSTAAINWILFTIAVHTEVQQKIDKELKDVLSCSNFIYKAKIMIKFVHCIILDDSMNISIEDLSKLTYLECVIKESMRLFPPVPTIGRKVSEDTVIGE